MKRPRAILFDLDDTLVDRRASLKRYARKFIEDFGPRLRGLSETDAAERIIAGDGGGYGDRDELFRGLVSGPEWKQAPAPEALKTHWRGEFPVLAQPMDGMWETLGALRERALKLGLVTNGSIRAQRGKIAALDLARHLDTVVISEAAGVKKPDARIFEMALADLGETAANAWFVGDHPENDVCGAERLGMCAFWKSGVREWPAGLPGPVRTIGRLTEIVDWVDAARGP